MTDAQKVVAINGTDVVTLRAFSTMEAAKVLVRGGDMGWLLGVANGYITGTNAANASGAGGVTVTTTAPWQTRRTAQTLVWLLEQRESIDTTEQVTVTGLTAALNILVTANVITDASRTAILAATSLTRKWPIVNGWPQGITIPELVTARITPG